MRLASVLITPGKNRRKTVKDVMDTDPVYAERLARRGPLDKAAQDYLERKGKS
jgi:hypothetical protein